MEQSLYNVNSYSPTNVLTHSLPKKAAFTLAEVLITLGIIGIVAALTLPTVIQNHRTKALEVGFKKSYANMLNAYNLTKEALGGVDISTTYTYYNGQTYTKANEFFNEFYKQMKVVKVINYYPITNYSNTSKQNTNAGGDYPVATRILPDGSSIGIWINGYRIHFYIDTNGPYKGPNRYGFDIFRFTVNKSTDAINTLKPTAKYTAEELEGMQYKDLAGQPCDKTSTQKANGMGCSYYALNDLNPEDEGPGYWKNLPW